MNKETSNIERQVMANVAAIYMGRTIFSARMLKVYALVLSLVGICVFVSVSHVLANFEHVAQGGASAITTFLLVAVLQTKLIVQLALLLGLGALVSLAVDISKSVTTVHSRRLA